MMDQRSKLFLLLVAVTTFFYCVAVMMVYQFWLIEYMSNTAVNGLLAGDPQYYHELAIKLSEEIQTRGWGAWVLRPDGQGPAGILSILYYLFGPYPLLVIFINSFLDFLTDLSN